MLASSSTAPAGLRFIARTNLAYAVTENDAGELKYTIYRVAVEREPRT